MSVSDITGGIGGPETLDSIALRLRVLTEKANQNELLIKGQTQKIERLESLVERLAANLGESR